MSTRRSSRISSKATALPSTSTTSAEVDDMDDEETPVVAKRKHAKRRAELQAGEELPIVKKPKTQRRGKLRDLPSMPLDVLFEIFSNLDPIDLLRLARTTKALRDILMRRSATTIWRSACASIDDLPDCPSDMSIPAFVNLLFDTHCYDCGHGRASQVIWAYRKRFCKVCFSNSVLPVDRWRPWDYQDLSHHPLFSMFNQVTPVLRAKIGRDRRQMGYCLLEYARKVCETYTECPVEEREHFLETQRELVKERHKFAHVCTSWIESARQERGLELEELRQRRKSAITDKLRELGFGPELDDLDPHERGQLYGHSLVRQPRELTDRIWATISPTLIPIAVEIRERRLVKKRKAEEESRHRTFKSVVCEYLETLPRNCIKPSAADLFYLQVEEAKAVKKLVEDTDLDILLTSEDFDDFKTALPKLVDDWKDHATRELLDILVDVRKAAGEDNIPSDMSILDLATSAFRCLSCLDHISYPRVLVHSCVRRTSYFSLLNIRDAWAYKDRLRHSQKEYEASSIAIKAYGFDPKVATIQDLDSGGKFIACEQCSTADRYCAVGWQAAARHISHNGWITLTAAEAEQAKNRAQETTWNAFVCSRCSAATASSGMRLSDILFHLQHSHACESPIEGEDYEVNIWGKLFRSVTVGIQRTVNPIL
ncbi:hypothetical protein HGRIS_013728 [Hohenbuehelia grisea]|uniref:F-box domain-containing protein n=1 Tax=Hohenbuehelia grisea TaxID=104357 RepID=A0ABR3IWP8_9AGAR